MNFRLTVLTLLSLSAVAVPASSQVLRPGLWEVNNKMANSDDPRMQQMAAAQKHDMDAMRDQLAKMPAEQRKAMEGMMAKLGNGSPLAKDGMTMKLCVTPEMAANNTLHEQVRDGCTNKRSPVIGGVMKISYVCAKPASTGEGTVTLSGDTGYTMDMTMHITEGGRNQTTSMSSRGKWLDANCGDVKPPTMRPPMAHPPKAPPAK
jgi:hypothetical protein